MQHGFAFTDDAEQVLDALREKISTGMVDEIIYTDFLSDLEMKEDCATWGSDSLSVRKEVWMEIILVCPELKNTSTNFNGGHSGNGSKGGGVRLRRQVHGLLEVFGSNRPRIDSLPFTYYRGEGENAFASGTVTFKDQELYQRVVEVHNNSLSLALGHVYSRLSDTRLKFITGRKFYAGYKGTSGIEGNFSSPRADLDGLALSWNWNYWVVQILGAWNKIESSQEAIYYALGLAHGGFCLQMAHQKFASLDPNDLEISLLGMEFQEKDNLWHVGAAISQRHGKTSNYGAYAEAGWRENFEIYQSTSSWTSPLQLRQGSIKDTVDGEWVVRGAGEGGMQLKSTLPLLETNSYEAKLENRNQFNWISGESRSADSPIPDLASLDSTNTDPTSTNLIAIALTSIEPRLLSARFRMTFVQQWRAFTYSIGSGVELRQKKIQTEESELLETTKGIGQIITWQGKAWRVKASLILQSEDYQGPYPEPLTLSFKHLLGPRQYFILDMLTGELRKPARYLRFTLKQAWELRKGVSIRHAIRLPYAEASGWANDLSYQVGIQTRF